jgi:hypothetical protein
VIPRCSAMSATAARLNLDKLAGGQRRRWMCSKSVSSVEDANREFYIKGSDRSVTTIADFVGGTIPLCVLLVGNGEPHSG